MLSDVEQILARRVVCVVITRTFKGVTQAIYTPDLSASANTAAKPTILLGSAIA